MYCWANQVRQSELCCIPDRECFEQLLMRARSGAHRELGALFELFRPYLLCLGATKIPVALRGKASPSDLVQETFLDVQKAFSRFNGQSIEEVSCWLRKIHFRNVGRFCRQFMD